MDLLTLDNPAFRVYLIAVALTVLKVMRQGWPARDGPAQRIYARAS